MSKKEKIFFGILIILTTLISAWLIWDNFQFLRFMEELTLRPTLCLTDVQNKVCDYEIYLYKCDYGVFKYPTTDTNFYYDSSGETIMSCKNGLLINSFNCRYLAKIKCSSKNVCESND